MELVLQNKRIVPLKKLQKYLDFLLLGIELFSIRELIFLREVSAYIEKIFQAALLLTIVD